MYAFPFLKAKSAGAWNVAIVLENAALRIQGFQHDE